MSHEPPLPHQTARPGPDGRMGPGPQPMPPTPPMDPALAQASRSYSARQKNPSLAWGLWACSALLGLIPMHLFYLGWVRRGLQRTALIVVPVLLVGLAYIIAITSALSTAATSTGAGSGMSIIMLLIVGAFLLLIVAMILAFIAWIMDAVKMTQNLEAADREIRRDIAAEHDVDSKAF